MEQLMHKRGCNEVHPENSHEEWEEKQNNSDTNHLSTLPSKGFVKTNSNDLINFIFNKT